MTARLRRRAVGAGILGALWLGAGASPAWAGALLPERGGSPNADDIASLYTVVLVLAGLVFVGVAVGLVFALVRYNHRRNPEASQIRGHTRLEMSWTLAATVLIVFIAVLSFARLGAIEHPDHPRASLVAATEAGITDSDELRIHVIGRQYLWQFVYPNGVFTYHDLVAPVGVTVRLDIQSVDVAHSWWIPKLGGKFDAVPGYTNTTWFRLKAPGVYRGQCAELCGRNHADMTATVRGLAPAAYQRWLARQQRLISAARQEPNHR